MLREGSSASDDIEATGRWNRWGIVPALLAIAAFITVFDNGALFGNASQATLIDDHRIAILTSLVVIQASTLVLFLALVPTRRALKAVGALLLVIASVCGYFMATYGTLIDETMIRNVAETNFRESAPLLTSGLLWHVLLYGVAPSIVLAFVRIGGTSWLRGLWTRVATVLVASLTLVGCVYLNFQPLSFFTHDHHELRLFFNPGYPIFAYMKYVLGNEGAPPAEREPLDVVATHRGSDEKPMLLVFVMGETARADRFQYNGYTRATNAYTSAYDLIDYSTVRACGTSTADSVPCIFSKFGRANFSHAAAERTENLFGVLNRVGVNVFWRDNSTGCKDVCDPRHFEQLADATDETLCDATGCFDEILLRRLDELVADTQNDHFIVLHQRGSHGPSYYTDVPGQLKAFAPECDVAVPRNCNDEQVNNAYDNTILYTDYFLARVIESLLTFSADYDVAMLYVSDHGESLGEKGLYLHGFPYAIAPEEQLRVPMLFWASRSFMDRQRLDPACLHATADRPLDHDVLFHTVLRLFGVEVEGYREDLDFLSSCRRPKHGHQVYSQVRATRPIGP